LVRILGFTTVGPVRYPNLVLAQIRSVDWQSERAPAFDERGGSSSPTEVTERLEDRRVARQAIRDEHDLAELIPALDAELVLAAYHRSPTRELAQVAQRLAEIVYRCTKAVDHNTLPGEPECRSCARPGKVGKQQYRGHKGVGVYEKAVKHRLCRWCYDHWRAEGRLPPVDVIDLYHRVSAKAAGLELAKRLRRKAS
jgi:hypothetical protein